MSLQFLHQEIKSEEFYLKYNFGAGIKNSWEHELVLEDSRYFEPELRAEIICLEGVRACPPEDVGAVPSYYEFCKAIKDKNHEEHETFMEWSGGDFNSEYFDFSIVNQELMKYLRWSRDRYVGWDITF